MESPTNLTTTSESNLKRYKGIRTSKKSLYSCADYYTKEDDEDVETLGPRSVSLSALASSDIRRPQSAVEPTRMSQLETLEAKMASIEVSLSNLGIQQHLNHHHQQSQQPRKKRNGLIVSGTKSSSTHSHGSSSKDKADIIHQHKENEFLKQSLKDKDHLILNLQTQLRKLSKKRLANGSLTSTDSGVVSLRILGENERKAAEERLHQIDKDMEIKRNEIKRINHRLERLDPSDNIDVRIQQAELEYELEREELNLMNLQEERRNLHTILDDNDAFQKRTENSLFASMPENGHVSLHSFEVLYDSQNSSFTVGKREDRTGTYVTWTRDDLKTLKRGDRIVELNGTIVISKGVNRIEEFWFDEDNNNGSSSGSGSGSSGIGIGHDDLGLEIGSPHPLRIVVMRTPPPPPPPRISNTRELHMLKEELSLVSEKLEQVNVEKREIHSLFQKLQREHQFWEDENEKLRIEMDKVSKDRENLKSDAVRLKHRISYLEEQVTDLLHRKDSYQSQHPITVFQKGTQKTIVAEPIKGSNDKQSGNNASRPPSVASSRNHETKALKTRLWETFRRATSSDSRSVCSVDSRRPCTENGYFKKRASEPKKLNNIKPEPPTKPVRLSLQRATSTANVYTTKPHLSNIEVPDLNPGLKRSNYSENTLLPDWSPPNNNMNLNLNMNDDVKSEINEKTKSKHSKHGLRWLRPASSMSYTMSTRNQIAKF